jgi:hypothetical protein
MGAGAGYGNTPGSVFTTPLCRAGGFMVSEAENIAREQIIVLAGQNLVAGHVMGKIMVGATAVGAAGPNNVGTPVLGAVAAGAAAIALRAYEVVWVSATEFEVTDPDGNKANGAIGVAFNELGLAFEFTAGGVAPAVGDNLAIVVSPGTEKFKEYNPANTDGSEVPAGILWDFCNATNGDMPAAAVVRAAVVNEARLTWFAGATLGQQTAALYQMANELTLIGRPAV